MEVVINLGLTFSDSSRCEFGGIFRLNWDFAFYSRKVGDVLFHAFFAMFFVTIWECHVQPLSVS